MLERLVAFAARRPWWWLLAFIFVTAGLYGLAIHAPLYPPFVVASTAIDEALPLVPWTAVPYLTYFLLMPSFVVATRRHPSQGALLVAAALVVVGNLAINILLPTEIAEPLGVERARASGELLGLIVANDTPRAALPSGHVALPCALACLSFFARLPARWVYVAWTAVLALAILTTKQHHFPDALGGLAWGVVGSALAWRLCRSVEVRGLAAGDAALIDVDRSGQGRG